MPTRGRRFKDSLRAVKFCPWCGSNDIQRDDFNPAAKKRDGEQRDHGLRAWVCSSCFQGYVVKLSPRAEYARYMIRQDAKLRPSDFEAPKGGPMRKNRA
jgi:hypothetical protein